METGSSVLATLLLTCLVSGIATLVSAQAARRRGVIAGPRPDRWHEHEVPLLGGIGILAGLVFAYAVMFPDRSTYEGWALGAFIIFAVGLADDLRGLPPFLKLIGQVAAACAAAAMGVTFHGVPAVLAVPMTLVWIVALTNAFNLLDNMDGLAAGIAVICALALFAQAWLGVEPPVAIPCIALAGSALGFLIHNVHPARVFMGDCGSMLLGYSLATFSVMGTFSLASSLLIALLFPCIVLAVPLFDTTFVSLMRALNGRSVVIGGKDHTSHRLVFLGIPEPRAVLLLWGLSTVFAVLGLLGLTSNAQLLFVVGVLIVVALTIFGVFLAQVEVYPSHEFDRASAFRARQGHPVLSRMIEHKRRLVETMVDFFLVIGCYIGAFLLRYDGILGTSQQSALNASLPFVIAVQLGSLYGFGVYAGLWRYASIADLVTISKAIGCGTILSALGLRIVGGSAEIPLSIVINSGLLLLVTVAGSRVLLRVLRHTLVPLSNDARRALIIGAGDAGELALREILNNRSLNIRPVGFVDDDPSKHGASIHGYRVIGDRSMLAHLVSLHEIQELVIAMPSVGNGVIEDLIHFCEEQGMTYRQVNGLLSEEHAN